MTIDGRNGYDGEQLVGFFSAIDQLDDELATLKGQYMADCKGPRGRIKDVMAQVRESDIDMNAFRELLRRHREDRAADARFDSFEADVQAAFAALETALGDFGDTDLGRATLNRARLRQDGDQTLSSL